MSFRRAFVHSLRVLIALDDRAVFFHELRATDFIGDFVVGFFVRLLVFRFDKTVRKRANLFVGQFRMLPVRRSGARPAEINPFIVAGFGGRFFRMGLLLFRGRVIFVVFIAGMLFDEVFRSFEAFIRSRGVTRFVCGFFM